GQLGALRHRPGGRGVHLVVGRQGPGAGRHAHRREPVADEPYLALVLGQRPDRRGGPPRGRLAPGPRKAGRPPAPRRAKVERRGGRRLGGDRRRLPALASRGCLPRAGSARRRVPAAGRRPLGGLSDAGDWMSISPTSSTWRPSPWWRA